MLQKEGQVRIPAGCAISGIFHKDGTRENGERIIASIRPMHDRSNLSLIHICIRLRPPENRWP